MNINKFISRYRLIINILLIWLIGFSREVIDNVILGIVFNIGCCIAIIIINSNSFQKNPIKNEKKEKIITTIAIIIMIISFIIAMYNIFI